MKITLTIDEMREAIVSWLADRQLKATEVMFLDGDGDEIDVRTEANVEPIKVAAD